MIRKCKILLYGIVIICSISINGACNSSNSATTSTSAQSSFSDPLTEARNKVIDKWRNEAGVLGTAKFIEDTYKEYPEDDVIANIYFYCISKEQYEMYEIIEDERYLNKAIEYAEKIDPDYTGEFSSEMQAFADSLLGENRRDTYSDAMENQERFNNLTNNDKKDICIFIQSRYDYYDSISDGKGAQYSDTIWQEAVEKYDLTENQISIIWMDMYSY